jgi:pullulanase
MKKIYILLILIGFSFLGITSQASTTLETLRIHYYRYDDSYTGFNMWVWENLPNPSGGLQFDFNALSKDEYGVFYDIDLSENYSGATRLGIIIKKGGWDDYREIGGDRFIDLALVETDINGLGHAYFVEQDIRIGLSQDDLNNHIPDYRDRILQSYFESTGNQFQATVISTAAGIKYELYKDGATTPILEGIPLGKSFTINTLFDISARYEVRLYFDEVNYSSSIITLERIYDSLMFEQLFTYDGQLGVSFEEDDTILRVWAPLSSEVKLNLYHQGHPNYNELGQPSDELIPFEIHEFEPIGHGAWEVRLQGDYDFKYYTFSVTNGNQTVEVSDPYAYSAGANGLRSMIVNFEQLNPEGWTYNSRPENVENNTDYIVYELHVRDLTTHSSWQGTESYRGKFLGLTEKGTTYTNSNGVTVTTGLDHIAELGVNAVQLLPIFDFGYVDEVLFHIDPNYTNLFNWGYMPIHFNTLEGTFSSNPFDGKARVEEFKRVVQAFHDEDIHVIMDVVYNHTGLSETSNFHQIVPGYYHRMTSTGGFSNGSGTGNETASERSMMRKFMIDSLEFLATEYNLSGFRFDLMALHDVETMNQIADMLYAIDDTIVVYGEPWKGGDTPLPVSEQAEKSNIKNLNDVGAFNDVIRDGIKGSVFSASEGAWIQGDSVAASYPQVMYGMVGGINHVDVDYVGAWHLNPEQTINYVSAHDNNTLYDKLVLTGFSPARDLQKIKDMLIQANAIVLTSQGIPFLHAGVEFMRSKPDPNGGFDENSYESPDIVNQLRWDRKAQFNDVFEYYKTLIQIRKTYDHFRMTSPDEINSRVSFLETNQRFSSIAMRIVGKTDNEPEIIVIHSGFSLTGGITSVTLPSNKTYNILTAYQTHDINGMNVISGQAVVPASTTMILVENKDAVIQLQQEISLTSSDRLDIQAYMAVSDPLTQIYYSSYHDIEPNTLVPGRYIITVNYMTTWGEIRQLHYVLNVEGSTYNVTLKEVLS